MGGKLIEYKGRSISIDTLQVGKGLTWTYQIDGGPLREGRDRPLPSEAVVIREAEVEAMSEIDRAESSALKRGE
jgi:hypothetical protein